MGQAKKRGTREERIAAAPPRAERQRGPYAAVTSRVTPMLAYLWQQFRVGPKGETIGELRTALKDAANATD